MDLSFVWKAIVIVIAGTFLLRIAGRKSISQMTLAQTVIMIGIGSLLIQPLAGKNIWVTIGVGAVLVLTLICMEFLQVKFDSIEKMVTGKSRVLINNGVIDEKTFKQLRFTVDQLEMKLRQQGVSRIEDVKWATLEPNGQVGVELMDHAKPVKMKDLEAINNQLNIIVNHLSPIISHLNLTNTGGSEKTGDIFKEVQEKSHAIPPSKHLD